MSSEATTLVSGVDVSRETVQGLKTFQALVEKWNPSINLVSKSDLADLWTRHILDSAQLFALAPQTARLWCDIGSGGGFPGLVIAIIAKEKSPDMEFVLIESDKRKAVFLRQVSQSLRLPVHVSTDRIDEALPVAADVLSARALAPLSVLCGFALRHLATHGLAIFPKGANATSEVDPARQLWNFDLNMIPSKTHLGASILLLRDISHV